MNKKLNNLTLMASLMAMSGGENMLDMNTEPAIEIIKDDIPPRGTKEYFFDSEGEFSTTSMRRTECVFKCFAINDKNAKRKFKNRVRA